MRTELKELVTELGITAVYVTHDQMEAMSMSDEIAVMNLGRIEQKGSPEEIYHHPATPFVARFVGRSNWIGENLMFRPEALLLNPSDNTKEYKARLKSTRFIGNGYELCFEQGTSRWFAFFPRRINEGEMTVFVKQEAILEFML